MRVHLAESQRRLRAPFLFAAKLELISPKNQGEL
jgi:hypothetical protein